MPLDWGRREYVTEELGDAFELAFFEGESPQRGESPESLWELFSASVGPLKAMSESLDDDRRPAAPVERGHPPAWQCLGARALADGDALFESAGGASYCCYARRGAPA